MFRDIWSNLNQAFFGLLFTPSPKGHGHKMTSHQKTLLCMTLSQGVSKDSGYWDYALLMFYDEVLHAVFLSGLTALTNFGWAERTAVLVAGALDVADAPTLLNSVRGVGLLFVSFGRNLTLVAVATLLFALPGLLGALGAY